MYRTMENTSAVASLFFVALIVLGEVGVAERTGHIAVTGLLLATRGIRLHSTSHVMPDCDTWDTFSGAFFDGAILANWKIFWIRGHYANDC